MFHGVPSWPAPGLIQRGADVAGAPGLEAVRPKHADPHHAARVAAARALLNILPSTPFAVC